MNSLFLATSYIINLYRSTLSTGLIVLCLVTSDTSLQLRLQESKCTNPCRDKNPLSSLKQWFLVFRVKSPGLNWRSFSTGSTIPAPPLLSRPAQPSNERKQRVSNLIGGQTDEDNRSSENFSLHFSRWGLLGSVLEAVGDWVGHFSFKFSPPMTLPCFIVTC